MAEPTAIAQLVSRFASNEKAYRSSSYNETQVRREFIDPFFEALGWDVANSRGYAEPYKDVVHEDAVKVGGLTKAPDYSFRVGGARKFFVEAKRPSSDIHGDASPAFQLRRYAWSAKLSLSVVTDFEEFAIYDCRIKPFKSDKASKARIFYCRYTEFADRWIEIEAILSRESVLKGSFDRFADVSRLKKGTARVDEAFLEEIEGWRKLLARNIALRNPALDREDLNFAIQRIIDRIIFLRICEDRGIEDYGALLSLTNGGQVYPRLLELFRAADRRYNSGLFHFRTEKDRDETPDRLTPTLQLDDKVLKDVIGGLYYPDSPYEFSVLPADLLGQVYEQFLGSVIRLTSGHQAVVEVKPDVKKAGGVFYTPTYIVNYIVDHTVRKVLEGRSVEEAARLRILDPACGSGSFLIAAYQTLMDWHRDQYLATAPSQYGDRIAEGRGGEWRLTTAERKRILLNNIYGVDVDPQAVEVTKLSLLLKVLEGESQETIDAQFKFFHERALPDLGKNIRSGNSLITPAFLKQLDLLKIEDDEKRRINAFDWSISFSRVFGPKRGRGFDVIIGNPPYGALFTEPEKLWLAERFPTIKGQPESYEYFIARALGLAAPKGVISFIVPTNFIESQRAEGLRRSILDAGNIERIASFRYNVWKANAAETLVFVLRKDSRMDSTLVTHPASQAEFLCDAHARVMKQSVWQTLPGARFLIRADVRLITKIERGSVRLGQMCDVSQGIIVYKTRAEGAKNFYIADEQKGADWKRLLDSASKIRRYDLEWGGRYLKYGDWLWCPRERRFFDEPKIIFGRLRNKSLARKLVGTYDNEGYYNRDNFNNILIRDPRYSLFYVLALFNSKLLNYWYKAYFDNVNINPSQVRLLPLRAINFAVPGERADYDQLVDLVRGLLHLNKRFHQIKNPSAEERLYAEIASHDRQIDAIIYRMYGLTDAEIAEIEQIPEPDGQVFQDDSEGSAVL